MLISAHQIWLDHRLCSDMGIWIEQGRIQRIAPLGSASPDRHVALILPMLTDLQVNGGGGTMINSEPTPDGFRKVAAAHRDLGTGTLLPTVITDHPDILEAAVSAALQTHGEPGIGGLHIEGPHIAPERRGTHKGAFVRPLDARTVSLVQKLRQQNVPVMLTLAPERADPDLFAQLVNSGAVLSAGHSTASADQTWDALSNGLRCFTHLFNAMPPMTSREPGILGAALNSDAYAGIIADGVHVSWDMLRIALRARPKPGLTFAVSDAMATVGGPDHFALYGDTIHVRGGALVNSEGSLAGAHIDLVQSLANLVTHVGLPLTEAIPMVSDIPRRVMGMAPLSPHEGMAANEVLGLDEAFKQVPLI